MTSQLTWAEVREELAALHEGLAGAHAQARDNILSPPMNLLAGTEYRNAFADLQWEVDELRARAERLLERVAEMPAPARRLEAVLADIRALGHRQISLDMDAGGVRCSSMLTTDGMPPTGEKYDPAEWDRFDVAVERGAAAAADDYGAAAEARLAQIQKLHAEKAASEVPDDTSDEVIQRALAAVAAGDRSGLPDVERALALQDASSGSGEGA